MALFGRMASLFGALVLFAALLALPQPVGAGVTFTYTVDTTSDGSLIACTAGLGDCSLRGAITNANGNAGEHDTIEFDIPGIDPGCDGGSGVCTISPATNLPAVTDPVTINGLTQPSAAAGDLKIELTGPADPANTIGLEITGGNSSIRGLVVNHFDSGIRISGGGNNTIFGNYVGVDVTGTTANGNADGIVIFPNSTGSNTIGGTSPGDGNLISGNASSGVLVTDSPNDLIQGNLIGTNAAGTVAIPNLHGITVSNATNTLIGGATVTARNVISGNTIQGISLFGGSGIQIQGNYVGVASDGTTPLGNQGWGMVEDGPTVFSVGGTAPGQGNVIAFNGLTHPGTGGILHSFVDSAPIRGNSIYGNGGLGIDLAPPGPNLNDPGDPDGGPNGMQNFPLITGVFPSGGSTIIEGLLNSTASTMFSLDLFQSDDCNPSNHGEGQIFLGSTDVATDAGGNASFSATIPTAVPSGATVTSTATSPAGHTSEFSDCYMDPVKGDVDCSGAINAVDALKLLRSAAALSVSQTKPCPSIGRFNSLTLEEIGDINCDNAENSVDALLTLRHNAGLLVNLTPGCRTIGTVDGAVVSAQDFFWQPDALSAKRNRLVGLVVENHGVYPHALRIAGADGQFDTLDDAVASPTVTPGGQKSTVTWQTPDQAIAIPFRCDIHPLQMTGTINLK